MIAGTRGIDKLGVCWVPLGVDPARAGRDRTARGRGPGASLLICSSVILCVYAWLTRGLVLRATIHSDAVSF